MSARKERPLTERQTRFVEAYAASGNATHSARVAGYAGADHALAVEGSKLLTNPKVSTAIAELSRKRTRALVATREERLETLSAIERGELHAPIAVAAGKIIFGPPSHADRTRASLAIARMNGELIQKHDVQVDVKARSVHVVLMVPPSPHGPTDAPSDGEKPAVSSLAPSKREGGDDGSR